MIDPSAPLAASLAGTRQWASHEMGHSFGLRHTHGNPAFGFSRMSTCVSSQATSALARDDHGQLKTDSELRGGLNANPWFNTGLAHWVAAGTVTSERAGSGQWSAGLQANGAKVTQRIAVVGEPGRRYRPIARYKDANQTRAGNVTLELEMRRVTASSVSNGCSYVNGLDLNTLGAPGGWTTCATMTAPTPNAFLPGGAANSSAGSCTVPTTWQGAELRISLFKNNDVAVLVDTLSIEQG